MWKEKLATYDNLVAMTPKFERLGKSMPYTTANTYMFSMLNKEGQLGMRLSKESRERFMKEHNATEFKSHGAVIREYVLIPDEMLSNLDLLSKYLDESYEYTMTLKPQPRKTKK